MPTPRRYASHAQRQAAYRKRQADAHKEKVTAGIPPLPGVPTIPGWPRWNAMTQRILLLLISMKEEMQDYYDQRSEAWQESERGEAMTQRLQAVEEAVTAVEAIVE
jgi:hypothetical protein